MVKQYDFLSEEECLRTLDIVKSLETHWINRASGLLPFYTLGAASYLDANEKSAEGYYQAAQRDNEILETHFPLLYERLAERISEIIKMPTRYADGFGLPGFDIFLSNKSFEYPIAPSHFDLQYRLIKWNFDSIDYEHPFSFTCPIHIPKNGAGLNYWEISYAEAKDLDKEAFAKLKASKKEKYFPYKLGSVSIHNGLDLHQIAPGKDLGPDDDSFLLQGHGLICDGMLRLYW